MSIRLSRRARQDLDEIRQFTQNAWGRDQWLKYYRGLIAAFDRISGNPEAGRDRSLLAEGMRSVNYEKHVIFYKPIQAANGATVILRIVHQRRNLPALAYYEDLDG